MNTQVVTVRADLTNVDANKLDKVGKKVLNMMIEENVSPDEGKVLFASLLQSIETLDNKLKSDRESKEGMN